MKKNIARTITSVVHSDKPLNPFFAFRPDALKRSVHYFTSQFQGNILFAVKTNPEPHVVSLLHQEGIRSFDVASLEEIRGIRRLLPEAQLYFMHPVKPRHAIAEAYHVHGVRHFSLDSLDELHKILQETNHAKDLCLYLRLAIPNSYAELNLGEKFGINTKEAPLLLREMRQYAHKLGTCFHVGSQCMHPDAYRIAVRLAGKIIKKSGVEVDYFNVGGGFPSIYPGMVPAALGEYFDAIHSEFARVNQGRSMQLLCEPGRALVAESASVVVRVELRKGTTLYINDGTYGSLFDAGSLRFIFPVKLIRENEADLSPDLLPFSFYGPTCDTLDFMKGPFYLPEDIKEGDYIEIGQIGAYGRTLATGFNGFIHEKDVVTVSDEPLMTMYDDPHVPLPLVETLAA